LASNNGGTAELSVCAAIVDECGIPRVPDSNADFTAWTNGHGDCPLNWENVVIMTTSGGGGI
jgi:hypothetical protein